MPIISGMNEMKINTEYIDCHDLHAGWTYRTASLYEYGNMAMHISRDPEKIAENRTLLASQTLPLSRWVLADQKHTANIARISEADAGRGAFSMEDAIACTDGLYTTESDLLIGVHTADCLGIVLLDPAIPLAAVVHSGWKGTCQAILLRMLEALKTDNLLHPDTLQAYFAPSLLQSDLEVGPEVIEQIEAMAKREGLDASLYIEKGEGDRSFLDNQGLNIAMLEKFQVPADNIHPSSLSTKKEPSCFSYRRDSRFGGEHFTFAWIQSEQQNRRSE